ncbi:hypothetical protein DE146DRAFT_638005 [Phaeosphaeria sp. MPI-PUGE-AT-0046c]|nr:hypothetical protein DE146DRAFT_638005 [Phaeosphaeria sp. MPI-PUGE-AT-0046c]
MERLETANLQNAVNHAATWLQSTLGNAITDSSNVIAYQGPNDLRYPILALAVAKIGGQMLVPFPLAPPPVKQHLLASANCKFLLHTAQENESVKDLVRGVSKIQAVVVPELDFWLNAEPIATYRCPRSWSDAKDEPWLIFHTSGTTGLPKLITYTNRMMTSFRIARNLPGHIEETQLGMLIDRRCYAIAPMSHFSGLCAVLQSPPFLNSVVITGPRLKAPSPPVIAETLRYSNAHGLVSLPFLLRAMTRHPENLDLLKSLDFIQWVGAALDSDTGNTLSQHVKLCPAMGTTECGPYFLKSVATPEDWAYYSFQDGQGIKFIERADNLYELAFEKSSGAAWQQVFQVFPDLEHYETKDLFRKHPSTDGLWAYVGRSDDVVVLSNSANINATVVEEKLMAHPSVQMALVGGSGRENSFAIIELTPAASEKLNESGSGAILDTILPAIEDANSGLSPYTRLQKEFVLLTGSERGLVKNPKGSVMRGPSEKIFGSDIEALFAVT